MGSLNLNVRKGGDVMKLIFLICFVINQVLSAPASIPGVEDLTDSDEDGYSKKIQDDHSDEYYAANLKKTSDINRDDRLDDVYGQIEDYYDHDQSAIGNPYHQSANDEENYYHHYLSTATNRNDQSSYDMVDQYYQYLLATMENYHQSADDDRPRDLKDQYHYHMSTLGNMYQQSANDVEDQYHQYLSNNINRHNKYDDIGGQFHQFLSAADNRYHQSADNKEDLDNQYMSAQSNTYHQSGKNKKHNDVKNPHHQYLRPVGNKHHQSADEVKNHYYPYHQSVYDNTHKDEQYPYHQYLSSATSKYHHSANDLDHHYHESDDDLPDDVGDQYHQNQFNPFISFPKSKEDSQVPQHSHPGPPHYPEQNTYQNYQQWMDMLSNEIDSVAIDPYPHMSESSQHNQYPAYQPHADEYRNRNTRQKHRQGEQNMNSWKNDYQRNRKKSNFPQNNNQ